MSPTTGALQAVAARLIEVGLKPDVPEARLARAVRTVAAAAGVTPALACRPPHIDDVIEHLATHESWFFRDPKQLAALARHVLPTLSAPVHVWCVGCANGQEAWSMAMLLAETRGLDGDWRVTASDLSGLAVAAAQRGVYRTSQLRGMSTERRDRFVQRHGDDEWVITDALRPLVDFVKHNVVTQRPPVPDGWCHVVLCRNVLIYLHDRGVTSALRSLGEAMAADGWLLLGSAESLWGTSDQFEMVSLPGAFAYRRAGAGGLDATPEAPPGPRARRTTAPPPAPEMPQPAELLAEARRAAAAGRLDEAARAYRQAAYLDPRMIEAQEGLADALAAAGDERGAARARAVADRLRAGQ